MLTTNIGFTTTDRITVRDRDLATELIGHIDFVEMIFLTSLNRPCSGPEKEMVNAILVTVTDHGLTPSAMAARLTYTGAPEAPQAAVAAGILGAGSVFLGAMSDSARMLSEAASGLASDASDSAIAERAVAVVASRREQRLPLYGYGHNIHVHGDPRVPALAEVSKRNGFYGVHWRLAEEIQKESARNGRNFPMNAASAIASMVLAMGLPPEIARGLALVGRCAGLVAHLLEEDQAPIGRDLWRFVLEQDSRNILP